jgi:hypothetical protein
MCSINHEKKAIFIHIPKTAGSYLAEILYTNYGFTNYYLQRPDHTKICFQNYIDNSVKYHENKIHGTIFYYKTSKYLNSIMGMNEEKWNTYYKFCFVRNPFDRIVSGWNYCINRNKYNIDFDKFINIEFDANSFDYWHTFMPQYRHIVNEKGEKFVNFIGYFENIEQDLKVVLTKLNLKITHKPFIKNQSKHDNYLKYYKNYNNYSDKHSDMYNEVNSDNVNSDNVDSNNGNSDNGDSDNGDSDNVDPDNVDSDNVDPDNVDPNNVDPDNVEDTNYKYNHELIEKVIRICNEDFNNFNYNKEIEKSSNTTVL